MNRLLTALILCLLVAGPVFAQVQSQTAQPEQQNCAVGSPCPLPNYSAAPLSRIRGAGTDARPYSGTEVKREMRSNRIVSISCLLLLVTTGASVAHAQKHEVAGLLGGISTGD